MMYWKVLNEDGSAFHGGKGPWFLPRSNKPGQWMPVIRNPQPCERGYHGLRQQDLLRWLGPALWELEYRGEPIGAEYKVVGGQARLIRRVETYNDSTLRLFACDCAARALKKAGVTDERSHNAIKVARAYARGRATKEQLAAARDAARDAASAAERRWQTKRLLKYLYPDGVPTS